VVFRALTIWLLATATAPIPVAAEPWSAGRIRHLLDSAFAVVELALDGHPVRHLPHHDETGAVDLAHLRAARARLSQVKWRDPANEAVAASHLEQHWRDLRQR